MSLRIDCCCNLYTGLLSCNEIAGDLTREEKKNYDGKSQTTVYPLSGFLRCADCGQNMIRRTVTKNGKKYGIGSHDLRGFWVGQENVLSADRKSFSTAATCFV